MVKMKSQHEVARDKGGKTVVRVYECESGSSIVTSHLVDAAGVAGQKTCTCTCDGHSTSKTCNESSSPTCDCSNPSSPKLSC